MDQSGNPEFTPLLTLADIRRFLQEWKDDQRLLDELPARIERKRKRYEAALLFAPPGFDPSHPQVPEVSVETTPPSLIVLSEGLATGSFELEVGHGEVAGDGTEGRLTWKRGILTALGDRNGGVSHKDLLTALKRHTDLGERESVGDKGFYNAVARLLNAGEIIKHKGLLYRRDVYDAKVAAGVALPHVDASRANGSGTLVLRILERFPEGLNATALREELAKDPQAPASIEKHGHYVYNVIAPLIGRGDIVKTDEGIYKLAGQHASTLSS